MAFKTIQDTTKADKFGCDWRFKGLWLNELTTFYKDNTCFICDLDINKI